MRQILTIIPVLFLLISCAKGESENKKDPTVLSEEIKVGSKPESMPRTVTTFDNPEENYLLVEQAVDAWLYFHLPDYKSYEPLIRSTEYDSLQNLYIHHLRLRMINPQGGPVTEERTFKVDMTREGERGNPFYVEEME